MLNIHGIRRLLVLTVALLTLAASMGPAAALTWDLATDFDTFNGNPNNEWEYGYINNSGTFVAFSTTVTDYNLAGGGTKPGWVTSNYDPNDPGAGAIQGLARLDLIDPNNATVPGWALSKVGGHTPDVGASFDPGLALAARWTAPSAGTYNINGAAWQAGDYPEPDPPATLPGGDTRQHELLIVKNGTSKAAGDLLHHTPINTRNGLTNPSGGSGLPEINSSPLADSTNPTSIRLDGISLDPNDQIVIRVGRYPGNANGFMNLDLTIDDNVSDTTGWDLAGDYAQDTESGSATGIGSNGAWSYGYLAGAGTFTAFDAVDTAIFGGAIPQWDISGGGAVPLVIKTPDGVNPLTYNSGTQQIVGDFPAGKVATHTPNTGPGPLRTTVYQWTAPRDMTVNLEAEMWKVNDEPSFNRRIHGYDIVHNGTVIESGAILQPEQGFNSGDPTQALIPSLSVSTDDTVELRLRPLDSQVETYVGADFRIEEGASGSTINYVHSAALDLRLDYSGGAPVNNPNGDWAYLAPGDTDPNNPTTIVGVGTSVGQAWIDPNNSTSAVAPGGPVGSDQTGIVGHGPQKVVWTAPSDIDLGGVELTGFITQMFEDRRQMQMRIHKNDVAGTDPNAEVLILTAPQDPNTLLDADFTNNAFVEGLDFLEWQRGFPDNSGTAVNEDGDANLDGNVLADDLAIWESQFGSTLEKKTLVGVNERAELTPTQLAISAGDTLTIFIEPSGEAGFIPDNTFVNWDLIVKEIVFPLSGLASVPEPSTLVLSIFACLAIGRRNRRS